eukprot:m.2425 g.2425  ORF g.2425 m.2425 type:complete len:375 (-) comp1587_c0_seq1:11-1135(-)
MWLDYAVPMSLLQRTVNFVFKRTMERMVYRWIFAETNQFRAELGLGPHTHMADLGTATPVLVFASFTLEVSREMPPACLVLGPLLPMGVDEAVDARDHAALWAWVEAHEQVALVTLGSVLALDRQDAVHLTEALLARNLHVLWLLSNSTLQYTFPFMQPRGVRFETGYVPLFRLLGHPHVTMAVHHGSPLLLYEALWQAKPSLCIPFLPEQNYMARRAEEAGVAVRLDRRAADGLAPHTLQLALDRLLALQGSSSGGGRSSSGSMSTSSGGAGDQMKKTSSALSRLSRALRSEHGLQRALDHIHTALEHDAPAAHLLEPHTLHALSWTAQHGLDVLAVVAVLAGTGLLALLFLLCLPVRLYLAMAYDADKDKID